MVTINRIVFEKQLACFTLGRFPFHAVFLKLCLTNLNASSRAALFHCSIFYVWCCTTSLQCPTHSLLLFFFLFILVWYFLLSFLVPSWFFLWLWGMGPFLLSFFYFYRFLYHFWDKESIGWSLCFHRFKVMLYWLSRVL